LTTISLFTAKKSAGSASRRWAEKKREEGAQVLLCAGPYSIRFTKRKGEVPPASFPELLGEGVPVSSLAALLGRGWQGRCVVFFFFREKKAPGIHEGGVPVRKKPKEDLLPRPNIITCRKGTR